MIRRRPRNAPAPGRWLGGLVVLALLLAACAQPPGNEPDEDDGQTIVVEEDEPPEGTAAPDADDESPGEPAGDPDTTGGGDAPAEGEGEGSSPQPGAAQEPSSEPAPAAEPRAVITDDRGPLGSACRPYVRGDVPALTIEVLHQRGARPADSALDHLVTGLQPVLDKPDGIRLAEPREIPGSARTWGLDELRDLAAAHRRAHSTDARASMLVLSVAGEFEDAGVLGLAMSATEIVLFPDQIGDLGTALLGGSDRIERSVLLHEAGHLLCLVNIGYESDRDHEDPDHPNHSRHRDSVMFWAVENDAVGQVFSGPPPDAFHEDDLADLRGLREGRH